MNRRFVGIVTFLAVSAVLVWVAGCTRPVSTGPIPKPQSAQSVIESPTPEAMSTVLATLAPGATATSAATGPEPTLSPPEAPTATPLPVATAVPAPTAAAPSGSGTSHTVKSGEWLFSIARQYGVSPYTLAQVNGIGAPYTIHPGQVLMIPSGGTAPVPGTGGTYTVQRGDTIFSIARKLGKTPSAIINANNLANANFIFPGQVLRIP